MSVESFVARRYLRPKMNLVTIISMISITGIMIGVAALITVLAVFNGFNGIVTTLLVGFDPHLRITPVKTNTLDPDSVLRVLKSFPEVTAAAPFIAGRSAIIHEDGLKVIQIRGMRKDDIGSAVGLGDNITSGRFTEGRNGIVLGNALSYSLHASIGDTISLLSQYGLEESLTQLAQPTLVPSLVTGLFESSNKEYDGFYGYTDMETARKLFAVENGAMGVEVRLKDLGLAEEVGKRLAGELGSDYRVETWSDLHRDLFAVMELERWAAFIILSLIIVVAVFNVLGSLTMTVIEKRRDIGIMKTMGASDKSIMRTYMIEGLMIGCIGTILGVAIGTTICWLQQTYGFYKLETGFFIIPALPVELRAADIVIICATSLGLALCAAIYPALRASRLLPADAVRWE